MLTRDEVRPVGPARPSENQFQEVLTRLERLRLAKFTPVRDRVHPDYVSCGRRVPKRPPCP
jgi:hypothetical protein